MEIEIIPLALLKIEKRGINRKMIIDTMREPDNIISGHTNRKIAQRIYIIKRDKKLLRVIYEEKDGKKVIITCYLTSQIKRYVGDVK